MLFTPSPPSSPRQPVSSSVESHSSSTRANVAENLPTSNDLTNGPKNTNSQLYDQDFFHSTYSSSTSSSHPSIHLSPIKKAKNLKLLKTRRRLSYPHTSNPRKRFPLDQTTSFRHAFMASLPTPDSHMYHTESQTWSTDNLMPVANPAAAAALVEDDEENDEEQKSISPSPINTPKHNDQIARSPTNGSTHHYLFSTSNRKVLLNVGGVRHESKTRFHC